MFYTPGQHVKIELRRCYLVAPVIEGRTQNQTGTWEFPPPKKLVL